MLYECMSTHRYLLIVFKLNLSAAKLKFGQNCSKCTDIYRLPKNDKLDQVHLACRTQLWNLKKFKEPRKDAIEEDATD